MSRCTSREWTVTEQFRVAMDALREALHPWIEALKRAYEQIRELSHRLELNREVARAGAQVERRARLIERTAGSMGLKMDPWQQRFLRGQLAVRPRDYRRRRI